MLPRAQHRHHLRPRNAAPVGQGGEQMRVLHAVVVMHVQRADPVLQQLELFLHGTTVATNAVLEHKIARVGLIVTEGYRHILQIARSLVPGGLAAWIVWQKPEPMAPLEATIEAPERMGVSHFLEHMFFRGSARYPDTVRMNALVESAGGNLNGVTMRDHGCYDTRLHPDELETGFGSRRPLIELV